MMMKVKERFALWILPLLLQSLLATTTTVQTNQKPSEQDERIRLKTDLIELRAVVTDKRGNAIVDLKKEDFELMENNKPQEVSFFSIVKIPGRGETARAAAPAAAAPTVAPTATRPAEAPARTVVLYVDT